MDADKFNELIDGVKDMDFEQVFKLLRCLEGKVIIPCYYTREDIEDTKNVKFTDETWEEFLCNFDRASRKSDYIYNEVWEMVDWVLADMGIEEEEESEEEDKEEADE